MRLHAYVETPKHQMEVDSTFFCTQNEVEAADIVDQRQKKRNATGSHSRSVVQGRVP